MRNRLTAASALVAVCAALGACGNAQGDGLDLTTPTGSVPSTSAPTTSPTETATVSADEQAVLDAYRAFYAALEKANADPVHSQDYLAPVATAEQFETTNGSIKAWLLDGQEGYGTRVLNPTVESVDGDVAIVHDCQDTSQAGVRQIDTQEPVIIGRNPSSAETTLKFVDGAWKVAATEYVDPPDAYC